MSPANNVFASFLTKKGPTVKAMQEVLRTIGEATTGTKDVLQTRLLTRVHGSRFPRSVIDEKRGSTRILSIDMGIKNLAYCVANVQNSTPTLGAAKIDILSWHRMDLSEAFREYSLGGDQKSLAEEAVMDGLEDEDRYTPENLSRMAYWFLRKMLCDWCPDIILIERQRWRSASSPTIQQWTVRVNTLEAVMWAVLTTLRDERGQMIEWWIKAVDPKRVGHFWLDGIAPPPSRSSKKEATDPAIDSDEDTEDFEKMNDKEARGTKKLSRGKAEKKAKIRLLRTWLNSDNPSTALTATSTTDTDNSNPNISFTFSQQERIIPSTGYGADATRQALLYATDTPSERLERTVYYKAYVKKIDDITDCFLQAVAWVAWAENLRSLGPQVDELQKQVEIRLGRNLPFPPKHLAEAVKELQGGSKKAPEGEKPNKTMAKKASKAKQTKT